MEIAPLVRAVKQLVPFRITPSVWWSFAMVCMEPMGFGADATVRIASVHAADA